MKRIGIITIQKCDNFGADLQAYALQAKLRMLGHDAENIDYLFYKHPRHLKREKVKVVGEGERRSRFDSPVFQLSLVNRVKERLFPIVETLRNFKCRDVRAARHRKFAAWFEENIVCSREYRSAASLYADPPSYDVYMVGSDQVWNPRMASTILPYFLDFVPKYAHCVSYASSFGVSELPVAVFLRYRELLRKFSHIGLREARGKELVDRMRTNAEVAQVLDPTLLLTAEEWSKVAEKVECEQQKYLLLYDLIVSPETVDLAHRLAQKQGLKVVRMGDGAYGPGVFVSLFEHAEMVVTNSFHGTAFSIIHSKPFVSVIPRGMSNSSRIESILKVVGLESQLIRGKRVADLNEIPTINWSAVSERLQVAREKSIDFLIRAVEGIQRKVPRKAIGNPPQECYAVWNPDAKVRAESTSGGLFTILAEETIRCGGIVYGVAFDADFHHVRHIAAESVADLAPIRKSKYVWSDSTDAIHQATGQLKIGRKVLFSGTPCQCAMMKAAAKGADENLLTVDFVCHGTPRSDVFAAYVEELERSAGRKLTRYEFRNKDKGWNFQSVYYEFDSGKKCRVIPRLDPYFHGFSVNAFLRQPCYSCPFATLERVSDITIADCWRVASVHPEWDDNRGTSLVLGNTKKGCGFLCRCGVDALPGGVFELDQAEKRNAALMQPVAHFGFEKVFADEFVRTGSFASAARVYMTSKRRAKYWLIYWIKRLGWAYFKHYQ